MGYSARRGFTNGKISGAARQAGDAMEKGMSGVTSGLNLGAFGL